MNHKLKTYSEYVLKIEPIVFSQGLQEGFRKRGAKDSLGFLNSISRRFSTQRDWKDCGERRFTRENLNDYWILKEIPRQLEA